MDVPSVAFLTGWKAYPTPRRAQLVFWRFPRPVGERIGYRYLAC